MNSLEKARYIRKQMGYWGRHIYWDTKWGCFRVIKNNSLSLTKFVNDLEKVE